MKQRFMFVTFIVFCMCAMLCFGLIGCAPQRSEAEVHSLDDLVNLIGEDYTTAPFYGWNEEGVVGVDDGMGYYTITLEKVTGKFDFTFTNKSYAVGDDVSKIVYEYNDQDEIESISFYYKVDASSIVLQTDFLYDIIMNPTFYIGSAEDGTRWRYKDKAYFGYLTREAEGGMTVPHVFICSAN